MYEGGDYNNFDYEDFDTLLTDNLLNIDNPLIDDAYSWNMEPNSNTNTATEHKTSESAAADTQNTTERKKKFTKRASTPHSKKVSPYTPLFYFKTLANPNHEN